MFQFRYLILSTYVLATFLSGLGAHVQPAHASDSRVILGSGTISKNGRSQMETCAFEIFFPKYGHFSNSFKPTNSFTPLGSTPLLLL